MATAETKQLELLTVENNEDEKSLPFDKNVWFNALIGLKNVDRMNGIFKINGFFNIFWVSHDKKYIDTVKTFENEDKFKNDNFHRINLHPLLNDAEGYAKYRMLMCDSPMKKQNLNWFFWNAIETPEILRFRMKSKFVQLSNEDAIISRVKLQFEGDFAEAFELKKFPFDSQFLNIKLKFAARDFKILSGVDPPGWLKHMNLKDHHALDVPINVSILHPAIGEWKLLPPWIDLTDNRDTGFCLIRLRVTRRPSKYVCNNIMPLILMSGLSLFYISDVISDKSSFILTLLLAIAAGRSELVPDMPVSAPYTLIDMFVLVIYALFSIEMIIMVSKVEDTAIEHFEIAAFICCATIWIVAIFVLFVYNGCRTMDELLWNKRAKQEFDEWLAEEGYDAQQFMKVDRKHWTS